YSKFFKIRIFIGLFNVLIWVGLIPTILFAGENLSRLNGSIIVAVYPILIASVTVFYQIMKCPKCGNRFGYFNVFGMFRPGFTIKTFLGLKCVHCGLEVK